VSSPPGRLTLAPPCRAGAWKMRVQRTRDSITLKASRGMKRSGESRFREQAVVLLSCALDRPTPKHIQVAHDMGPVLVVTPGDAASVAPPAAVPSFATPGAIPQNDATALVVPSWISFQDDGVRPDGNRLKEISGAEAGTVGDSQRIKMMVGNLGASGRSKTVPRIFGYFLPRRHISSPEPLPTSIKCEMPAKIVGAQTCGVTSRVISVIAAIENTDISPDAGHQVEAVSDIFGFPRRFAAVDRLEHAIPRFGEISPSNRPNA